MPFSSLPLDLLADGYLFKLHLRKSLKKVGCLPEATEEFQWAGIELRSQQWPGKVAPKEYSAPSRGRAVFATL
jgi:hypothetical protein